MAKANRKSRSNVKSLKTTKKGKGKANKVTNRKPKRRSTRIARASKGSAQVVKAQSKKSRRSRSISNENKSDQPVRKVKYPSITPSNGQYETLSRTGSAEDFVLLASNQNPTHTLDDIAGIEDIKQELLRNVIRPFSFPEKAAVLDIKAPRGILFVGKPGTGKTALAEGIVNEIRKYRDVKYYQESTACLSKYFGESEKNVRDLFEKARQTKPSVIFFDEIDGVGGKRSSSAHAEVTRTLVTTLLSELNKVENGQVLVIAATNFKDNVDSALIRKGRFDVTIKMPLPDQDSREEILNLYARKSKINIKQKDIHMMVELSDGFSGSDLECLVKQVKCRAVERVFPDGGWTHLDIDQLETMQARVRKIERDDIVPVLDKFVEDIRSRLE